jgi:hypothetical protein
MKNLPLRGGEGEREARRRKTVQPLMALGRRVLYTLGILLAAATRCASAHDTVTEPPKAACHTECAAHPQVWCVLQTALETTRSIADRMWRVKAFNDVAVAQAQAGNRVAAGRTFALALETARSIMESGWRSHALRGIAAAQSQAGDVPTALDTARGIENRLQRAWALRDVAIAQAQAGDVFGALETARSMAESVERAKALGHIAVVQAQRGDKEAAGQTFTAALAALGSVTDSGRRPQAFGDTAMAQAQAGEVRGALETARSITDSFWCATVLSHIGETMVQQGFK